MEKITLAYFSLALSIAAPIAKAENTGIWGDHVEEGGKGKAFITLLCHGKKSARLVNEAQLLGIQSPEDLVSAMRVLWCSIDKDDVKRLKSVRDRVHLPFEHMASGHDHLVEGLADLQGTLGSLSFGKLPKELEVEVSGSGDTVTLRSAPDLDRWKMKRSAGRWRIQGASFCECDG